MIYLVTEPGWLEPGWYIRGQEWRGPFQTADEAHKAEANLKRFQMKFAFQLAKRRGQ